MNNKNTYVKLIEILAVLLVILTAIVWFFFWAEKKEVWFCDEVYTYESSNGIEGAWPHTNINQWMSGNDVGSFLSADRPDFLFSNISSSLYDDHVPLFFWIFRILSVLFFQGRVSIWNGLTINFVCYLGFVLLLYKSLRRLFREQGPGFALVGTLICGIANCLILEQATMLRMYMMMLLEEALLLLFAQHLLLAYDQTQYRSLDVISRDEPDGTPEKASNGTIHKSSCENVKMLGIYVGIFLVGLAGFLTHFHFWVFYAATASVFCLYLLIAGVKNKKLAISVKTVAVWVLAFLLSIGGTIGLFRYCIWNLNRDKGKTALGQVVKFSGEKLQKLRWGFTSLSQVLFGERLPELVGVLFLFGVIAVGAFLLYKIEKDKKEKELAVQNTQDFQQMKNSEDQRKTRYAYRKTRALLLMLGTALLYQCVVCFTLPAGWEVRYLWGSHTILLFCFTWCLLVIVESLWKKCNRARKWMLVAVCFFLLSSLPMAIDGGNGITYLRDSEKNIDVLRTYREYPWVVADFEPGFGTFSYFDFLMPGKICFMTSQGLDGEEKIIEDLAQEGRFILYCLPDRIEELEDFLEESMRAMTTDLSMGQGEKISVKDIRSMPVTKSTYLTVYLVEILH